MQTKALHIEDLFTVFNNFQSAVRRSFRNVGTTEQIVREEQAKLKEFFDSYGIEIDYSERPQ